MGYKKQATIGFGWMGLLRGLMRGAGLVRIAIIARILTPVQFGLFAIATLVLSFLETFTETGVNVVLIQEDENIDEYINSAWIVSIFRGVVVASVILISSKFVAMFFNRPDVVGLIALISIVPFLRGFINPSIIKFRKELKFKLEFIYNLIKISVEFVVGIALTYYLKSPVGLVFGMICSVFVETLISHLIVKPRPTFSYNSKYFSKLIHGGKWVTMAGIFNYLFGQLDDIIVGRVLGTGPLGYYQMAYKFSTLPISEVGEVFGKVTFPVYKKIEGDRRRLQRAFLKVSFVISAGVIPFGLLLIFFPAPVIRIILGEQWLPIKNTLIVLAVFGMVRSISGSSTALFLAIKKQQYVTVVTFVSIVSMVLVIFPLIYKYYILGAAASALFGSFVALPFIAYFLYTTFHEKS